MQIYKIKLFNLIVLFISSFSYAQQRTLIIKMGNVKCIYNFENGKITGTYTSFYQNGYKKSEGKLENGYRTGNWIVWDSTGRKRMERVYNNPFEYKRIFPAVPIEGPIALLMENKYKLEYDSTGIIKYAQLKAEAVVWRHKFWRYLKPANNEVLFTNNKLFNLIKDLSVAGKIEVFDTINDRFTEVIQKESIKKIFDYAGAELMAIEIKEENIFDMERLVSEYRIVGICPVVKINNKIQKLFWVYFPDIRKYLGKELITKKTYTANIKTLDDLFVLRKFSSTIIKTTIDNPHDYFIKDYRGITAKEIADEQEQLELIIIEAENDIWISLTK
jgi:hypothetical protein